ncbi:ABC1 kinase family protein [Persicobacter diffluens]|uniref:ABC transporter n=1 Tax=Persicobacter diffluens TaxID=981 RepID=A0AAN4VX28_9BACT|nr:ABC transporter [Persicobacter diffluens]
MKEQNKIPVSKVERASKFMKAGVKVGGNYIKHYAKKVISGDETDKADLNENNAKAIYGSLSELKGSALKVAQMMAMDKNLLPTAYQNQFAMAQYSAPPLSYPLVVKTFQKYFGKSPVQMFDKFSQSALNAASIGQVHEAYANGNRLAVKIQYPGVAESVSSDLRIAKPLAAKLFGLSNAEVSQYMGEVEEKLLEETDYDLELKRSQEITAACAHIENVIFPNYHPEFSCKRILTMDWMPGAHLKEFLQQNPSQEVKNKIGQALWDFYDFQIHSLQQVHADPHPGNFLMQMNGDLGIIDFGCVKVIPDKFYQAYFSLLAKDLVKNDEILEKLLFDLEFLFPEDTPDEKRFFSDIFREMIQLLGKPFHFEEFDFSDSQYFNQIYDLGERIKNMKEIRKSRTARGSRHGLYINRTYFGLYNLLHDLKAKINTKTLSKLALIA